MKKCLLLMMAVLLLLPAAAFAQTTEQPLPPAVSPLFENTGIPAFALTSEDLTDGVWNPVIARTSGQNVSPQLSWEPVPDAACYVIYMVDTKVLDFVHWMSNNITETELPQGWATPAEYVGPYPPPFETHTYDVYVLALREPVETIRGTFNAANVFFAKNVMYLNEPAEGITGNILAYGYLSGSHTAGE